MSNISQLVSINQKNIPNFGENQGVWEYRSIDNELICYTVRTWDSKLNKKTVKPWTFQDGFWKKGGFLGLSQRPIYGLENLKFFPDNPVLVVEGEKTASAGKLLFPNFNCLTWLGGCKTVDKAEWTCLKNKIVYLLPDNDENGYEAMYWLCERLREEAKEVYFVNIKKIVSTNHWDIADLLEESAEIEVLDIFDFIISTRKYVYKPKLIDVLTFPDLSEKDRPLNTTENIQHLLNNYGIKICYNLMLNAPEFKSTSNIYSKINQSDCFFVEISNHCVRNNVPKLDLYQHLNFIADKHRYHPAIEFIESKTWDGISRINDLLNTVVSDKQELANKLIYRWLISCVAALYLPNGIASEGALVFQGDQKIGKTYWLLKLVPEEFRYLVKEGISVNTNNKDDLISSTSVWIAELGEIESTFRKSDVEELKNFISRSQDTYRAPFGRAAKTIPRRTIFYGSVNSPFFLADQTGNRRYWTIATKYINYNHTIDMQQIWAELKVLFDNGESYRLTPEEQNQLSLSNTDHEHVDPIEEMINVQFRWDLIDRRYLTVTQILQELDLPIEKSKRNNTANILRKLNVLSKKSKKGLLFEIPPLHRNHTPNM